MKGWAMGLAGSLAMLVLILDSKTALDASAEGLALCVRTVIPSLFPFIVLSNLLMGCSAGRIKGSSPLGKWFSLPGGADGLLVPALLGGYPVGAQCIGKLYRENGISRQEAQRLLAFCSNAGPSFLFGMVGQMFPERWMVWALWAIVVLSAWMVSTLLPAEGTGAGSITQNSKPLMSQSVWVMGQICGWIIIFRILIGFLQQWFLWILPETAKIALIGLLEISNGCLELGTIEEIPIRFLLCAGMLSFGGVCVGLQTGSVIGELDMGSYWMGKGLQAVFSLLIAGMVMGYFWLGGVLLCLYAGVYFLLRRKNSSNLQFVGV